jgi:hypothetical protein
MAIFNFPVLPMIHSSKFGIITTLIVMAMLSYSPITKAESNKLTPSNQSVKGLSGGSIDSQGCGFIAASPNYQMTLVERSDYLRLTVQSDGGEPTLLVLGPNGEDSFCVLGDKISGLKPEISGVWEPGNYKIYIGDLSNSQHQFVLDISTDN